MGLLLPESEFARPDRFNDDFPNPSGMIPVEYKVLIRPFQIDETDETLKSAKEAGIILAENESQREQMAQVIGLLVAVGGNAFDDFKGRIPRPGDRVMIAKYAGIETKGLDGRKYRLCHDKDVAAVLFEFEGDDPDGD